jgi:signal transduction histidine kinase
VSAASPSGRVQVLVVGAVGALATVAVAFGAGMTTDDALQVAGIGAGVALLGTIGGLLLVRGARRRSVSFQIVATALVVLVPVAVGAWLAARTMFLNEHDLGTLAVILVASATVGIATALVLGNRVGRASHQLIDVARGIGNRAQTLPPVGDDVPEELARLYDELQDAATRLREAREREQSLDSSRRELVAWASHDLRTPLSAIRALSEALEDGIVDADSVPRYHSMLRVEAERLSGLVDDLFELSRTQGGALRLKFERVSLDDLISDVLAGSAPVAAAKHVNLEGRLVGPPPSLEVSAPEVLRALRNLLENAIRHTPSDGSVIVEAGVDDEQPGYAYIAVRDTGGGVPVEDVPRIFDVAFRGDRARTPGAGAGAGLGLAIAKGFVEAHDGDLDVRNEAGGATFTMRLPLVRAS